MATVEDTFEGRHQRMVGALGELEEAAADFARARAAQAPFGIKTSQLRLTECALKYARAVRRLAGVR